MSSRIKAILFDLDGVITDTAEYHYQGWQYLADAEGIPFDRAANENLRGVSRRESLMLLLAGRTIDEATAQQWMDRKNQHYQALLQHLTAADLLPGVAALLAQTKAAGLKMAVVSASHNTPTVLDRLGIATQFDTIIAGVEADAPPGKNRPKPAPDLFLLAAERLGLAPAECLVVEDAASGVAAGLAAGMVTVGIGPQTRVGEADLVLPDLTEATLDQLLHAATWSVTETRFEAHRQHHWETVLTIGNGYVGTRGSLEEGLPGNKPATLVHGLWDDAPLVKTELANAFDWTAIDLWIDNQPFRLDQGQIADYSRSVDLQRGELRRSLRWTPPGGTPVELSFVRIANLADPHGLGIHITVTPLTAAVSVRLRARLNGFVENEGLLHWDNFGQGSDEASVYLSAQTRHSNKRLAQAMRLRVQGTIDNVTFADSPHNPGWLIETQLGVNQTLTADKLVSVYTERDTPDPVAAALVHVKKLAEAGFVALRTANRMAWADFWAASNVEIEGDDEAQLALRHALFQLRIAASTHDERVSIGARSLSGFGYRGHAFWDTEIFTLPFFTYTQPGLARNLLMYRWHTLAGARRKAQNNHFAGAQYAWESAETGDEVTPRFVPGPQGEEIVRIWCGDIELHITTDVAYGIWQYWLTTGDDTFLKQAGAQILLETARFWESRVEPNTPQPGLYSISDVIGPDEYHEHVDNNAYTNAMASWHLRTAIGILEWLDEQDVEQASALRQALDLTPQRLAHWQDIATNLVVYR
ncbi:MAG: beta-phosphoglucomutase, partial [Chloroflexota bacterium]|nr:beta-phosphoglucomutase [Chloroflexota bacterium]